ncbi:MAG TPA: glycosyltransferase family 4 protein [Candidatus Acidoferrum sp.]|nr:glycosyltransferase family 4 protein [Candidatus Acidoferrum sp.]
MSKRNPILSIVSPFIDASHGTERIIAEWISRFADDFEIHLYSQRVADVDLHRMAWHKIPEVPGPHLLNYVWWFFANHARRFWDQRVRGINSDIVFSPGINCLDADVISVHIVFAEFLRQSSSSLEFRRNPVRFWLRLLHRKLYYRLIVFLERYIYAKQDSFLILIAKKTAADLERFYRRQKDCFVFYLGVRHDIFNPQRRTALRSAARAEIGLPADIFAVLLVGNDFHKKGVATLLQAGGILRDLPIVILIAGNDDPGPFLSAARENGIADRVRFLPLRPDVEFYYAAADAYAGPSLEDTFALPPVEAMACGLPVIVSVANGTSEIITHETDGLILEDATDAHGLAEMIRRLCQDANFRTRLGARACETAQQYTWERNAREVRAILERVLQKKSQTALRKLARES